MKKTNCKKMKSAEWEKDIQNRLNKIESTRREIFSQIKVNKLNIYHLQIMFARNKIWSTNLDIAKKDLNEFIKENENSNITPNT